MIGRLVYSNQLQSGLLNSQVNSEVEKLVNKSLKVLFTKFLTSGLTHESDNSLNDWLDWLIPTNYRAGYLTHRLIPELKI